MREMSFKVAPSLNPFLIFVCRLKQLIVLSAGLWLKSTVRENLFPIRAFPVNAGNGPPNKAQPVRSDCGAAALLSLLFCFLQYNSGQKRMGVNIFNDSSFQIDV